MGRQGRHCQERGCAAADRARSEAVAASAKSKVWAEGAPVFFRKKHDIKTLKYPTTLSFWDQAKVKTIAASTTIYVNVTSFIDEKCAGRLASYTALQPSQEIHGFTEWPRSLVTITFDDAPLEECPALKPPTIGMWMYEVLGNKDEGFLGRLQFTFFDHDRSIRTSLKQAHATSLASGAGTTSLTIFKEQGVGEFSHLDREHGYSYESRFPFCGMSVRERLQSRHLKKWALPFFDEDFSKEDSPF